VGFDRKKAQEVAKKAVNESCPTANEHEFTRLGECGMGIGS